MIHDSMRRYMLTQICGNNFKVLKVAPALTVAEERLKKFVSALGELVESMHHGGRFRSEPLGMARRIIGSI
jgi:ornithine--oxo-acid transaminase